MPLDRAGADEQPATDLRVGQTVAGKTGNLLFLCGQLVACLVASLAHLLTRCQELSFGALRECFHSDRGEHLVSCAELLPGVDATILATQPLAVVQVRSGKLDADASA